ncbi:MAG: hypothetical protein AAGU11_05145 [Syntrophobacteraceae bacterium]
MEATAWALGGDRDRKDRNDWVEDGDGLDMGVMDKDFWDDGV